MQNKREEIYTFRAKLINYKTLNLLSWRPALSFIASSMPGSVNRIFHLSTSDDFPKSLINPKYNCSDKNILLWIDASSEIDAGKPFEPVKKS